MDKGSNSDNYRRTVMITGLLKYRIRDSEIPNDKAVRIRYGQSDKCQLLTYEE